MARNVPSFNSILDIGLLLYLTDTYRRDCMPTEIYPYWAGLCCMADFDSLIPRGIAALIASITVLNPSYLAVVLARHRIIE